MPSELPDHELTTFLCTVTDAVDLAAVGEVLNGFRCLLGGQERAEEAEVFGEPWGTELAGRYRAALLRYTEHHGIRLE